MDLQPELLVLQPAEAILVDRPAILQTLLGSCAGITLRVPRLGLAAMCHAMLPTRPAHLGGDAPRYVEQGILHLLDQFYLRGAFSAEVEAKLFGCADVLPTLGGDGPTVGRQNAAAAHRVLDSLGLKLLAEATGGLTGVEIRFTTATGEVLLRRLAPLPNVKTRISMAAA